MSSITFSIDAKALLQVLPHLSKEKNRPILQCFYCEAGGVLVGTNGGTLGAHANAHTATEDVLLQPTPDFLRMVKKAAKADTEIGIEVDAIEEGATYAGARASWQGASLPLDRLAGPYPDWRQVVPRGDAGSFSERPLNLAFGALFGDFVRVFFFPDRENGLPDAMLVQTQNPDFLGLWMPADLKEARWADAYQLPDWAQRKPETQVAREEAV